MCYVEHRYAEAAKAATLNSLETKVVFSGSSYLPQLGRPIFLYT